MSPVYEIKGVAGEAGQTGVYATRDIPKSTIICTEAPFLKVPEQTKEEQAQHILKLLQSRMAAGTLPNSEHLASVIASQHLQKTIETTILAGLTSEQRVAFWAKYDSLHEGHFDDASLGSLKGNARSRYSIYLNNRFPIGDQGYGLYWDSCRFNHSCRHNADWYWNHQEQKMEVQAVADIAAGQEIYISYLSPDVLLKPRLDRRTHLKTTHSFYCKCGACDDTRWTKTSDTNRKTISGLHQIKLGKTFTVKREVLESLAVSCLVHSRIQLNCDPAGRRCRPLP
jgi:hypothetical protein